MTPVTVRDARPEDADAIGLVAEASWRDTYRGIFEPAFIDEFLATNYSREALANAAERAGSSEDAHFLVAERDGTVVAFAHYAIGERGPQLFRIYADPAHYGTGAGSALLDQLEARLDVESYVLDVHARNERGRSFYDRRGFVIVGGGATVDGGLTLRRSLRPPRAPLPIESPRLRLRSLADADLDDLHAIYGDAEAMRLIGRTGQPTDRAGTERVLRWFQRHESLHGFGLWAVDDRQDDRMVGVAGLLWEEGHGPEVEVVYLLRRDRWGRGYATEAARAVLAAGHGSLELPRIIALAYPENVASQHVMQKAGMQPEGEVEAYGRRMVRFVSEG
ncbi:MAG: GNAT family N-acetyltransferase [Chloroflexota bacterium]|nr:GNAT family N-acetyltransferase [Chloroflexota bacterium]